MNIAPNLRGSKITISDDLTTEERQTRRKIVDALKAVRAENIVDLKCCARAYSCMVNLWLARKVLTQIRDAIANESSPSVTPALSPDDDFWQPAPRKEDKNAINDKDNDWI